MKTITSLADVPLPMPDGSVLPAKGTLLVRDYIAGSDRVRSWGLNVVVADYEPPVAEDQKASTKVKAKAADKTSIPDGEKA